LVELFYQPIGLSVFIRPLHKAIQARSARWRFRRVWIVFAGNTSSRYRSNRLIPAYITA